MSPAQKYGEMRTLSEASVWSC